MTDKSVVLYTSTSVEQALAQAILDGTYAPGAVLPGERDLAAQFHVTRPTLREALRSLERDGWLAVQHGKRTVVKDYWREGGLNVLSALIRSNERLSFNLVLPLLEVRQVLAPVYAREAVAHGAEQVIDRLLAHAVLADTSEAFAAFDWLVHRSLAQASANPIYPLLLNGFTGFYEQMARLYFSTSEARQLSSAFYKTLLDAARRGDPDDAERLTRKVMQESLQYWTQQARDNFKESS